MKYIFKILLITTLINSTYAAEAAKTSTCTQTFSYKNRPQNITDLIHKNFLPFHSQSTSEWGRFNGQELYEYFKIDQHKAIKQMIINEPTRKDFYVLEIGAGDFQWGKALSDYLNKQIDLPHGIKIHIISVRGERNQEENIITDGICTRYNFGLFNAEFLHENLLKKGFDLTNKIDLIMTRYALRHFVDPIGSLQQAYNLSKPKTGLFFFDYFFFSIKNQDNTFSNPAAMMLNIYRIAKHNTSNILLDPHDNDQIHYVLQRTTDAPFDITMCYIDHQKKDNYVGGFIRFEYNKEKNKPSTDSKTVNFKAGLINLYGSKEFYDQLSKEDLFIAETIYSDDEDSE